MTTPPPYGTPVGPPAGPPANDKTTLWGVLGIVFAICCWPLGIVFAVLSLMEAKKHAKQPTLAYVGFAVVALVFITNIILFASGAIDFTGGVNTSP